MSSTHTAAAGTGDTRRALGERGERLALAHLERLGFALVARNHRTRWGEIDLIVFDGTTLVFVEVRRAGRRLAPAARWSRSRTSNSSRSAGSRRPGLRRSRIGRARP